ncbi:hypothetical protein NEMBOFW57_003618 [Staphylotrichum longicolle]|uniref:Uncharacterized protein n=1 Tax=Staphylotrichum longicolle TaxID=669026 RepID=A0AAD4I4U2_9PEZI|nr:hypothetical protein NEMBOFW57_003618 [Staphylotrichum longicolle]
MPVYVVTGARTGIGLEYVRQLAESPSNTVFALVRSLSGDLTALHAIQHTSDTNNSGTVHILECDISSAASIAALPALLHSTTTTNSDHPLQIDVLINNAAILHARPETALTLNADSLHAHIATTSSARRSSSRPSSRSCPPAASPTSPRASARCPSWPTAPSTPEITPYSISKAALNMLTVHQARQVKGQRGGKGWWLWRWIRGTSRRRWRGGGGGGGGG